MYHNIVVLSKSNQFLSTINEKRREFYISRNLAEDVEGYQNGRFTRAIRLKFDHKPNPIITEFNRTFRDNICMVCGAKENLTRHHVVPSFVKIYFPVEAKEHSGHWLVLCCRKCHNSAETFSRDFTNKFQRMTREYCNLEDYIFWIKLGNYSRKQTERLGKEQLEFILSKLRCQNLDDAFSLLPSKLAEYKEKSAAAKEKAARQLIGEYTIEGIKQMCRENFLKTNPKFMPDCFLKD
jgi:hypothetical protein